jgi:hypothetical protein
MEEFHPRNRDGIDRVGISVFSLPKEDFPEGLIGDIFFSQMNADE